MRMPRSLGLRCALLKIREQHEQIIVCNPASGDASQSHAERGTMDRIARDVFLCGGGTCQEPASHITTSELQSVVTVF